MRRQNPHDKPSDPEEYKRFLETARQIEASEDADAFDRAFKKVTSRQKGIGSSKDGDK
jgi:hypothetical protein